METKDTVITAAVIIATRHMTKAQQALDNKNPAQPWSAEQTAQQHNGAHKDKTLSMEQVRSAADVVVAAGTKKEGEGAKWMLLLLELLAASPAPEAETETLTNEQEG